MNNEIVTVPGVRTEGGYYAGRIRIDGIEYALIVAPKSEGQHADTEWSGSYADVDGAKSYCNGFANTVAMAESGSELAKWTRSLRIGGFDDWYIPSQDELEICYRNLKPTTDSNSLYSRSGINVSAIPASYPYSADMPKQTLLEEFRDGGAQAFDKAWYWSSTQHADGSDCAWFQGFGYGDQLGWSKGLGIRARAVRRLAI